MAVQDNAEEWRVIPQCLRYEVSSYGRVRHIVTKRVRKFQPYSRGKRYLGVTFFLGGKHKRFQVHRLVYEAFCGEVEDGKQIHHRDLNPANNRVDNLIPVTPRENVRNQTTTVLNDDLVMEIRDLDIDGYTVKEIADRFGLNWSTVYDVVRGDTWVGETNDNVPF